MKNYKTSIFGLLGAIGVAILTEYEPTDPRWLKYAGAICNGLGVAGMGYMASDKQKDSITDFFKKKN